MEAGCNDRSIGFVPGEDPQSLLELADRYRERIYRLALYCTGDSLDAADVVEQTFVTAQTFPPEIRQNGSFYRHLLGTAVTETLGKIRQREGDISAPAVVDSDDAELPLPREIVDWGQEPEERYTKPQLQQIIQRTVNSLEPPLRIPLVLREVEHLPTTAIAKLLSLPEQAAKRRLLRARLELRERLNEYFRPA